MNKLKVYKRKYLKLLILRKVRGHHHTIPPQSEVNQCQNQDSYRGCNPLTGWSN